MIQKRRVPLPLLLPYQHRSPSLPTGAIFLQTS